MKKTIGYLLFVFIYYLCRPLPLKKKRVMSIITHDDGGGSNVSLLVKAMHEQKAGYSFTYITKGETAEVKGFSSLSHLLTFFIKKPYQLARAEIILLDNVFLPMAYLRVKRKVKVVQLWHGTGTIKKFGQDVNTGKLKELEYRANQNITHLIVNSDEIKRLYSKVFGVREERVYPIGLPKTDQLFRLLSKLEESEGTDREKYLDKANVINQAKVLDETKLSDRVETLDKGELFRKHGIAEATRLILYAPTFRDNEITETKVWDRLEEILRELPPEYSLGLRLHPYIAKAYAKHSLPDRVYQLSFESDLNSLIMASEALITDYSSIVFEYCLTGKPMVFYAYDLDEFSDSGRGFYYNYMDYVPGPVAQTGAEVARLFRDEQFSIEKVKEFRERNYTYLDGKATLRLIKLIQKG